MTTPQQDANAKADRIMQMLDVGLAAIRGGDDEGALLAVMEAHKTALSLTMALPDRSSETPQRT